MLGGQKRGEVEGWRWGEEEAEQDGVERECSYAAERENETERVEVGSGGGRGGRG